MCGWISERIPVRRRPQAEQPTAQAPDRSGCQCQQLMKGAGPSRELSPQSLQRKLGAWDRCWHHRAAGDMPLTLLLGQARKVSGLPAAMVLNQKEQERCQIVQPKPLRVEQRAKGQPPRLRRGSSRGLICRAYVASSASQDDGEVKSRKRLSAA